MPAPLSRRRKAAIIVRLLLSEGAPLSLDGLPDSTQAALASEIAGLRYIDADTLRAVIGEFLQSMEQVGLAFPGGLDGALSLLDGHISPTARDRLLASRPDAGPPDPWARLARMDPADLLPFAQSESIEVAAVLLSKLATDKAAELLSMVPGDRARRIALAVAHTGRVSPQTVLQIGQTLLDQIDTRPPVAFAETPEARIGAILNSAPAATRDEVLSGLETSDADFAERVRTKIFTFADIPGRIVPRDVPTITRAVAQEVLVTAIAGAKDPRETQSCAFLLDNMSQRLAGALRDEVAERGDIPPKEAEAAMAQVVGAIRTLESDGDITLTPPAAAG